MIIDQLFLELLQIAIGNRRELSRIPSKGEWNEIFAMSKKQALTAIAFAGVTRMNTASDYGASVGMDGMTYLTWLGLTSKVAQRNREVTAACAEVCKELAHDGLASCILKGQGNLEYYPEHLQEYRMPGDIDVWCEPSDPGGQELAVIEYSLKRARLAGQAKPKVIYHHTSLHGVWNVDVEIHHRPTYSCSFLRNHSLQNWCRLNAQFGLRSYNGFGVPTVSFNAVYQLCHIYTHLFDEGIGLRQLLDYYFVLRTLHVEQGSLSDRTESMAQWAEGRGIAVKSNDEIMRTLSRFGMKKFAGAVMYVLQTVFAMPDVYLICPPNEKEGKFLLDEIMQAGNFGQYDDRIKHGGSRFQHALEKTKHNLRLLTHYPKEVLCEPFFRVYHWLWRRFELWRW